MGSFLSIFSSMGQNMALLEERMFFNFLNLKFSILTFVQIVKFLTLKNHWKRCIKELVTIVGSVLENDFELNYYLFKVRL